MYESTARKPAGWIQEFTKEGEAIEHDTLQCVHCGMHWKVQRGSGKKRGFCTNCMGPTCGQHKCDPCYPQEKQLDDAEKYGQIFLP